MKRYESSVAAGMLAAVLAAAPALSQACTVTMGGNNYATIQAAVNAAPMIAQINVDGSSGVCYENVLIPNVTLRMVIEGANNATLSGAAGSPTLDVRVKGFLIQHFTITGGSRGIQLQRNANAIIDSVVVQNTGGDGIEVDSMALAVITNSTIQNNPGAGIVVQQLANARIGTNLPEDGGGYAPNTIQNNAGDGIVVSGKATAQVTHNTISANGGNGINISGSASVNTAGNTINSNRGSGIAASGRSYLSLGVFNGVADPDTTTSKNSQYGISAGSGAAVTGNVSQSNPLAGNVSEFGPGANAFASSSPTPAANLTAAGVPFPYAGLIDGTWSGNCYQSGVFQNSPQGTFGFTIAVDGSVSGTYSGTTSGEIFGNATTSGSLSASGTAGAATWKGGLTVSNGALHGSGTWTLTYGTAACNGNWSSY